MPTVWWAFVFHVIFKMTDFDTHLDADVATELDEPTLYAVVMHNDDYTTMEFVVFVLTDVFAFDIEKAVATMLDIHHKGKARVGAFPKEIAEMKIMQVENLAEKFEYPLLVTLEKI